MIGSASNAEAASWHHHTAVNMVSGSEWHLHDDETFSDEDLWVDMSTQSFGLRAASFVDNQTSYGAQPYHQYDTARGRRPASTAGASRPGRQF